MNTYKLINLSEIKEDRSGINTAMAELSLMQNLGFGGQDIWITEGATELFVFDRNSSFINQVLSKPEKPFELNLNDFVKKETEYKGYNTAYFEKEYNLKIRETFLKNSEKQNQEKNLISEIDDCILMLHPEMFFSELFRFVISKEYEDEGNLYSANLDDVLYKWRKLSALSLMICCRIKDIFFEKISKKEETEMLEKYSRYLEFGGAFDNAVSMYFIFRPYLKKLVEDEFGNVDAQQRFYEIVMQKAHSISTKRLEKHLGSKEYFGLELVKTPNNEVLKVILTPYGQLMKERLVDFAEVQKLESVLDDFMSKNNLKKLNNNDLGIDLGTKLIYQNSNGIYYYKLREMNGEYMPFGEQSRKNGMFALVGQGQCNLTKYSEKNYG